MTSESQDAWCIIFMCNSNYKDSKYKIRFVYFNSKKERIWFNLRNDRFSSSPCFNGIFDNTNEADLVIIKELWTTAMSLVSVPIVECITDEEEAALVEHIVKPVMLRLSNRK